MSISLLHCYDSGRPSPSLRGILSRSTASSTASSTRLSAAPASGPAATTPAATASTPSSRASAESAGSPKRPATVLFRSIRASMLWRTWFLWVWRTLNTSRMSSTSRTSRTWRARTWTRWGLPCRSCCRRGVFAGASFRSGASCSACVWPPFPWSAWQTCTCWGRRCRVGASAASRTWWPAARSSAWGTTPTWRKGTAAAPGRPWRRLPSRASRKWSNNSRTLPCHEDSRRVMRLPLSEGCSCSRDHASAEPCI